jgi:hypothetical protein
MSTYSGPHGKGARRLHDEIKRSEAGERAANFERDVARIAYEQNIEPSNARTVAYVSRRVVRAIAAHHAKATR